MSVILDALKKLDREKSYRGNGTSNIATEILKPDPDRPVKRTRLYFLIVALAVIVTFAMTYAVMRGTGSLRGSSASKPVNLLSSNQEIAPALPESGLRKESSTGSVSPPAESQQVIPPAPSREPVRDVRKKEKQMHPKIEGPAQGEPPAETRTTVEIKLPAESKTPIEIKPPVEPKPQAETKSSAEVKPPVEIRPPVTSLDGRKTALPEKVEVAPESVRKTIEATPSMSPTTRPSLKLSAIVWYEDPSMRFAMINGIKAVEGSEIEGVKVVEINPTSIRFFHDGRYFEISITR